MRHPLLLPTGKNVWMVRQNHKAHAHNFTRRGGVDVPEASLLFASAITKSFLYLRQSDKAYAQQITLLSLTP